MEAEVGGRKLLSGPAPSGSGLRMEEKSIAEVLRCM